MSADHSNVTNNIEMQLSEIEMLQSMFPEPDEFALDDPYLIDEYNEILIHPEVLKDIGSLTSLSYSLNIPMDCRKVQLNVQLNKSYPSSSRPDLFARSDGFDRLSQLQFNTALAKELDVLEQGDLVIGQIISWIQENASEFFVQCKKENIKQDCDKTSEEDLLFTRLWIYSHHIYSKIKRRNILDLEKDFNLTGFSMPGKPGVICLEGSKRNTTEAWAIIKSWNWKKINVKFQEEESSENYQEFQKQRRFENLQEVGFVKSGESRDYHMDMGEFYNYLVSHKSDYMFKELFGIDKAK